VASEVLDLFTELAAIPSPPGEERAVADVVTAYLRDLGLAAEEDDAGKKVDSTIGNIFARVEGTTDGTPIFLCAHLDTVPPVGPIEPVVDDGVVRNTGGTILGADNKSAVAAMLDATRRVLAENRPHAGIELLFTPKEEVGLLGAAAFDHTRLRARVGYVYDQAAPIGDVILGAPHSQSMEVRFHGRAAHSGMYPEEGRSAIAAAARAIADLRLGRIDEETTANVGTIQGGTAGNIVPEWCTFLAEARSHDERKLADVVQEMLDAISFAAGLEDCEVETEVHKSYRGYRFKRDDEVVRLAHAALERAGYTPSYGLSGGAADANVFNERGLQCLNLANGMQDIHTPDERIAVDDLDGMVEVTLALLDVARGHVLPNSARLPGQTPPESGAASDPSSQDA
jgi:tripeptide aminopeptidase